MDEFKNCNELAFYQNFSFLVSPFITHKKIKSSIMKNAIAFIPLLLLCCFCSTIAIAQVNVSNYVFNEAVRAIKTSPDGSTYIGGDFTEVAEFSGSGLVIDRATAAKQPQNPVVHGEVEHSVAIPAALGGGWYFAGTFTRVGEQERKSIARLNQDGTLHAFNPNINGSISAMTIDSTGNLFLAGSFTLVDDSTTYQNFVKFDSLGVLTAFNPTSNGSVDALVVSSNGSLYVGGNFTQINTSSRAFIAKFDPTGQLTPFNPGLIGRVQTMAMDGNDNLYVGGLLVPPGNLWQNTLTKFDANDSLTSFSPVFNGIPNNMVCDGLGSLYVSGTFSIVNGQPREKLAKFDATGLLVNFNPGISGSIFSLDVDADNHLYVGGRFFNIGWSFQRRNIAKFTVNGSLLPFRVLFFQDGNPLQAVRTLSVGGLSELFIGGNFVAMEGIDRNHFAKLNPQGVLDTFAPNFNNSVHAIAIDSQENLFVGGAFTSVNSHTRHYMAKFYATLDLTSFDANFDSTVHVLLVDSFDNLFVGGSFTYAGALPRNALVKFDEFGNLTPFNAEIEGSPNATEVRALALDSQGWLYIGGNFTHVRNTSRIRLAKLNTVGALHPFHHNINGWVLALAIDTLDNLYIGGSFSSVRHTTRKRLAKFNANGSLTSFSPDLNGSVNALAFDQAGHLYVGGAFTTIGGALHQRLARFNSADVLTNFEKNYTYGRVKALEVDATGNLHVGGSINNRYAFLEVCQAPPSVLAVTDSFRCDPGSVTLVAQASSGEIVWYDAPKGGNALHTGAVFATPHLANNTTFYAEAVDSSCVSDFRLPAVATINPLNLSVASFPPHLTSWAFDAAYQWLDCNNGYAILPGEIDQLFTATINGSYAVEVSQFGCVDTSDCFLVNNISAEEIQLSAASIAIAPNPSAGLFNFVNNDSQPIHVFVADLHGRQVHAKTITEKNAMIDLTTEAAGVYFLTIERSTGERFHQKLIVK